MASRPFILLTSFFGPLLGSVGEFDYFGLWWVGGWVGGQWVVGSGQGIFSSSYSFPAGCGWVVVEPFFSFSYSFPTGCGWVVGGGRAVRRKRISQTVVLHQPPPLSSHLPS